VRAAEAHAREQKSSRGGFGGKQMASQQVERTAELQDPEVRAELDWRVRKCVRGGGGRLGACVCRATNHAQVGWGLVV
jgi:hypothetical protein